MATPSTPKRESTTSTTTTAIITPTGSWRHPAMDQISKRQAQSAFTDACLHKITYNGVAILVSFAVFHLLSTVPYVSSFAKTLTSAIPSTVLYYLNVVLWLARALLAWNVIDPLLRLLRPQDDFADIPLTPKQRQLLGLDPNTPLSPAVKETDFVTPPRYLKSTPASRSNSPIPAATPGSGSPTVPRKSTPVSGSGARGGSQDTPSPLRAGVVRTLWGTPSSNSPKGGVGSSVTPSNRWAYEKGLLQRKSDGIKFSPSKNLFGAQR